MHQCECGPPQGKKAAASAPAVGSCARQLPTQSPGTPTHHTHYTPQPRPPPTHPPEHHQEEAGRGQPGHGPPRHMPPCWFVLQGAAQLEREGDQEPGAHKSHHRHLMVQVGGGWAAARRRLRCPNTRLARLTRLLLICSCRCRTRLARLHDAGWRGRQHRRASIGRSRRRRGRRGARQRG